MYWLGGFIVVVFVLPNTVNFKERRAFSDRIRLEDARTLYNADSIDDSVVVAPGPYYRRGEFAKVFLGKKHRDLWTTPVKMAVFDYDETGGGLKPEEFGGGDQTISIKLEDKQDRSWALRSVNKDQQAALPGVLRITVLRSFVRDQVASVNPYGHLVIPVLAEAIGLHHTTPRLVFVPYDEAHGDFNQRMAGRVAYLEENLSGSWKNEERFGSPEDIVNTEEMFEKSREDKIPVDTMLYLKTRIFDLLISDWDRHEGNWEWALTSDDKKTFEPIAKDRDNAFFMGDEGLASQTVLLFARKFQSYRRNFKNISALSRQARDLDRKLLQGVRREAFLKSAKDIATALDEAIIDRAFAQYPPEVHEAGKAHAEILRARLDQLPEAAGIFHEIVNKKKINHSKLSP